jgi:hypothetical protein
MKSGNLNFWNPLGHSRPVTGLLYLYCTHRMYENALTNFRSEFSTSKQGNKFLSIYFRQQIRGTAP